MRIVRKVLVCSIMAAVLLIGCGGGGASTSTSAGSRPVCSANYATPNYVQNRDPSTGEINRLLYWSKFPLRIAFRNDRVYSDGLGGTISVAAVATDAFNRWRAATSNNVDYLIVGSTAPADIEVRVAETPARPGSGGTLGQTAMRFEEPSGRLLSAEITLYVWPGITFDEISKGLRATSAHELGHALFLLGHSEHAGDLMFPQINPLADKFLSTQDINSLRTSYCDTFGRGPVGDGRAPTGEVRTVVIKCGGH